MSREELLAVATAQARLIEELTARVEALTAQVAELTRRLGQDSGNSSLPPSSDRFGKPGRDRRKPAMRHRAEQGRGPGPHRVRSGRA